VAKTRHAATRPWLLNSATEGGGSKDRMTLGTDQADVVELGDDRSGVGSAQEGLRWCGDDGGAKLGFQSGFVKNEDHWASFYRGFVTDHSR
jgi:hypothetical protein